MNMFPNNLAKCIAIFYPATFLLLFQNKQKENNRTNNYQIISYKAD